LAPGGGIIPARSLRIIFSVTSACSAAFVTSYEASVSPPAFARSLWHVTQYCLINAFWSAGAAAGVAAG
jgi:hypothetical protein